MVDSLPAVEVLAMGTAAETVPVNKRRRVVQAPVPVLPPMMLAPTAPVPMNIDPSHVAPVPPQVAGPSTRQEMVTNVPPEQPVEKRKRARNPVRRIPVTVRQHQIWDKLDQIDAGLSLADWLSLDPSAVRDTMDRLRTLNSKGKKITMGPGNRKTITAKPPKKRSTPTAPMVAMIDQWDDGSSDWEDDEESESYSDDDSSSLLTDVQSMVNYPYDLQKMRKSAPLKAPIAINGHVVECTFDSGAAVSVMSERLATKLGIETTSDRMRLTSFDAMCEDPCRIAVQVPIMLAGHLRSEHMCIQPNNQSNGTEDYCLLGMTWFRVYDVSVRLHDNVISFPASVRTDSDGHIIPDSDGPRVELQGYSSHLEASDVASSMDGQPSSSIAVNQVFAVAVANSVDPEPVVVPEDGLPFQGVDLPTYLEDVVAGSEDGLSLDGVPDFLKTLIKENQDCFVEVTGLGRVDLVDHEIPVLPHSVPIRTRPFRLTWEEQEEMTRQIQEMLEMGLIRPSKGVWSSPCFFIKKKDGTLRLVIDYRRLNKMTIKDSYPLPIIDSLLDSLAGATIFTTLDAASGYHQVPMNPKSMIKTGFITPQGTFEFVVMPFGLTSAPATYQRMMTNLLGPYLGRFVLVFIDDVIVFSHNEEEHKVHVELVFKKCQAAGLKLKFKKCSFGDREVDYLGHRISGEGISPNLHNTHKIQDFIQPRNVGEIRSFLGTTGYYRRFLEDYATIATPLTSLLVKNATFRWGPEQHTAYQTLKNMLTSASILAYPDRMQVQILTTDASNLGISAILSQSPDGSPEEERVVSFNSRTLQTAEKNYAAVHLEALAITWAVQKYRHYLMGRHFILRTDNAALTFILNPSRPSPKLSRWAATLLEYDFQIVHHPGKENPADSLSRLLPQSDTMVSDRQELINMEDR